MQIYATTTLAVLATNMLTTSIHQELSVIMNFWSANGYFSCHKAETQPTL